MASAALYYVVNHMPPGADQMAAALLCFEQARQWLQHDNSDKAKAGFAKVHHCGTQLEFKSKSQLFLVALFDIVSSPVKINNSIFPPIHLC